MHAVPTTSTVSSSLENPVPPGSTPTLTCTIELDPSVDNEVEITVSWSGPVFGFGKFITTEPVLNSSAKVPTYMSSAFLDAEGTFYDSGMYKCSSMVSSVRYQNYIRNSTSSQGISGKLSVYICTDTVCHTFIDLQFCFNILIVQICIQSIKLVKTGSTLLGIEIQVTIFQTMKLNTLT